MTPNDALDYFYFTNQPAPSDLVTEREIREVLDPETVDQIIDHQRHFHAPDGTRVWDRAECQDLYDALEVAKEVHL